jgi:hypothetical protein
MEFIEQASGNLKIVAGKGDFERLREIRERVEGNDLAYLDELLDGTRYQPIRPEDVGALTNAPMFTDDFEIKDDGTRIVHGSVWWFPNYQVENFADTLIKEGSVVFTHAGDPEPKLKTPNLGEDESPSP